MIGMAHATHFAEINISGTPSCGLQRRLLISPAEAFGTAGSATASPRVFPPLAQQLLFLRVITNPELHALQHSTQASFVT